ncbi:MAG: hypothetical protein LUI04_07010, partial [Porphyromonadaceae bacterium]|nr:hypothetical protein [Porphyromonadaceae bacterium]
NTVYYAMGKKKELKAQGIIVGKTTLTGPSVDASNFTEVDLRELSSIDFPPTVKKAVLLTSHPAGSYTLVKEGKVMTKLTIDNPEAFWSVSKYLVISY